MTEELPISPDPRYEIKRYIASGGFGRVYKATNNDGKEVAIKLFESDMVSTLEEKRRMARNEVKMQQRSKGNKILPITDSNLSEGEPFIVYPLMEKTLNTQRDWKIMPEKKVELVHQMIQSLKPLKDNGIIHRDIDPRNFLLDENNNLYLSDFGSAIESDIGLEIGNSFEAGKPHYRAPEIWEPEKAIKPTFPYSFASDMYAQGLSAATILLRENPFDGNSQEDVMDKHIYGKIPQLGLPGSHIRSRKFNGLQELLESMTAKDPRKRAEPGEALERIEEVMERMKKGKISLFFSDIFNSNP